MQWIQYDKKNRKSDFEELSKSFDFLSLQNGNLFCHIPLFLLTSRIAVSYLRSQVNRAGNKVLLAVGGVVSTESKDFFRNDVTATKTVEYYDH